MKLTERQKELIGKTFIDFQQTSYMQEHGVVFNRAEGLYCWDTNGKRYFDAVGGVYVATLGHRHPEILDAMRKQMEKSIFVPPLHGISDTGLEFIEKMGSITPGNVNFIKGFSGGSEANEAAFKFVRQYYKQTDRPTKYKFISMYLSYHGATMAAATASGGSERRTKFEPQVGGFLKVPNPLQFRDRFADWEEANKFCADWIEEVIVNENPDTIAGVLLEPICNTAGIVKPTTEFFQRVRKTCDNHNVALILDEVLTGIAKTGRMFASEIFGIVPDVLTTGKGLSGGVYPMGVMAAREDMAQAFIGKPEEGLQFGHGHTWAGNPLAGAVGIATIDIIQKYNLCEKARSLGDYLNKKLEQLKKYGCIREIRGSGVLRGVELVKDPQTNEPFPKKSKLGDALKITSVDNGLIMRVDRDWFAVCPPLIAEKKDIDELYDLIEQSLKKALDMI
ncbi:MAG: aspartate aminotransferase family protein [Spirochaetales bacterium]|nr:aspartate aminotransferase family protein [Spirochaetales bacterium]